MGYNLNKSSDEDLVKTYIDGNPDAFAILVQRYQNRLYKLAYMMLGNESDAEDVVQDVMITVYQKLASYKSRASFFTWLYRITLNRCRDRLRRKKLVSLLFYHPNGADTEIEHADTRVSKIDNPIWDALHQSEINRIVEKYMLELNPVYRQIIILRDIEGLTYDEICKIMGLSMSAMKSKLFRARNQLRQKLMPFREELLYD